MDIKFPRDLQPFVDEQMASGRYNHVCELIVEAMYHLCDLVEFQHFKHERLKRLIAVGTEQADRGELIDGPTAIARLRERINAGTEAAP